MQTASYAAKAAFEPVTSLCDNAGQVTGVFDKDESETTLSHEVVSLSDFMKQATPGLLASMAKHYPPVFCDKQTMPLWHDVLNGLKRTPFEAQKRIILAVATLLLKKSEPCAIINADMGTGKTLQGIALAAILAATGYKRTLVICPPHLVHKWRREIEQTLDAKVVLLNGSDTLQTLIRLKSKAPATHPEFYILGRVRMRMGHHWVPAVIKRRVDKHTLAAACPDCAEFVRDSSQLPYALHKLPLDRKLTCSHCTSPLWQLQRKREMDSLSTRVKRALCQLPGIGKATAKRLLAHYDTAFLAACLDSNLDKLLQLMDSEGNFIFSEKQVRRIAGGMQTLESGLCETDYPPSEYIKRYLPKGFFDNLIVDEAHEYKNGDSAQGQALGAIASCIKHKVLLTGTLMGGYACDLFYLLWRMMPTTMKQAGFSPSKRGSLHSAEQSFMRQYGLLQEVMSVKAAGDHRTAKGKKTQVRVVKKPGFSPEGLIRHILPYTAFLRLEEMDKHALPSYTEKTVTLPLSALQKQAYLPMQQVLSDALKKALSKRDNRLLGTVMTTLLAWPDTCFLDETVVHPGNQQVLYHQSALESEDVYPKEAALVSLCLANKTRGRRTLVYSIYTGVRNTLTRLKDTLEKRGLAVAVLTSSISAATREAWIAEKVDSGIDVLLCHPELVKTGLDLMDFASICFMQTGYNVYTLMQATRRSWRIGQTQPVEVTFLGYEDTAQMQCLELMAKKVQVTQSTAGMMPDSGLDSLMQTSDNLEIALAKQWVTSSFTQ